MNQTKGLVLAASQVLALTLTLSCSSGDEGGGGTQGGGSSSSGGEAQTYNFCLFNEKCLEGPYTANDCEESGGVPSNNCPYNGDGGDESSSSLAQSSSSLVPSSSSFVGYAGSYGSLDYKGQIYRTVEIGTQTWMADNLNYAVEGSKCYDDDPDNCEQYGRLYDWSTAMALPASCNSTSCSNQIQSPHQGICPDGWHIPRQAGEWSTLVNYVRSNIGCSSCDGGLLLKATSGWISNGNGTDQYGFSALPGGRGNSDGSFSFGGACSFWWSASEDYSSQAYNNYIYYRMPDELETAFIHNLKSVLYSVRCMKDN